MAQDTYFNMPMAKHDESILRHWTKETDDGAFITLVCEEQYFKRYQIIIKE